MVGIYGAVSLAILICDRKVPEDISETGFVTHPLNLACSRECRVLFLFGSGDWKSDTLLPGVSSSISHQQIWKKYLLLDGFVTLALCFCVVTSSTLWA